MQACRTEADCIAARSVFRVTASQGLSTLEGTNLALVDISMAIPGDEARSELITSSRNDTASKQLSGVFRHLLAQHGEAFALVRRLGMRSELQPHFELERDGCVAGCLLNEEMVEGYAALRAIVQAE